MSTLNCLHKLLGQQCLRSLSAESDLINENRPLAHPNCLALVCMSSLVYANYHPLESCSVIWLCCASHQCQHTAHSIYAGHLRAASGVCAQCVCLKYLLSASVPKCLHSASGVCAQYVRLKYLFSASVPKCLDSGSGVCAQYVRLKYLCSASVPKCLSSASGVYAQYVRLKYLFSASVQKCLRTKCLPSELNNGKFKNVDI